MLLKNLCSFSKGIQIKRDLTSIDYVIPYLHYGDLYKKYNVKLNLDEIHSEIIKVDNSFYNSKYQINNNNIVMNLTSENYDDLGKCIIVKNSENKPFLAGMETHLIKIHSSSIIPEYLNYYFESDSFLKCIQQFITGMKVFRVKPTDILNIDISLPNLQYQQHIVDIIGSLDDKIESNNKIIDKLWQKLQLVHTDFKSKNKLVEKNILELADIKYGKGIPTSEISKDGLYSVYGSNGIIGYLNNYTFKEHKIAISCRGNSSGIIHLTNENSTVTSNSLVLDFKNFDYTYYFFLEFMYKGLYGYKTGSAQPQITIDNLKILNLQVPKNINGYIKNINDSVEYTFCLKKENQKLFLLKQFYLKKFFG